MMKKKRLFLGILSLFFALISGNSHAAWGTRTEYDVFTDSEKIVMVGQAKNSSFLVFECIKHRVSASYVESADFSRIHEGMLADLFVKVDDFPRVRLSALTSARNQKAYAVRAEDPEDSIKKILHDLRAGKKRFLLGFETEDNLRLTTNGDLSGSTDAVNKFVKECGIILPSENVKKS